jgi:hypothetical protein
MQLMRTRYLLVPLVIALATAACSGNSTPPPSGGGGGGGANGYEGSLTTSGGYAAAWTVTADAEVGPINSVSSVELTSDKQTFGHVGVKPDGSIHFGSGAPGLSGSEFTGTGAKVTLDPSGAYVCAFTIDTDLTTTSTASVLHLSGGLTVHWHPEGLGDAHCP